MTQSQKLSTFKLPHSNAAGITLGGGCWFQKNLNASDTSTWDGVVIDPDGGILGAANLGITVWEDGKKRVQIQSTGISIYGGASVWAPEDWDPSNASGIVINASAIAGYSGNVCQFIFQNTGNITLGATAGKQITFVASSGVLTIGKDVTVIDQDSTPRILGDIARGGYRANKTMDSSGYLSQDYTTDGTNYKRLSAANLTNFGTAYSHSQTIQNAHGLDLDHINDGYTYRLAYIKAWTMDNLGDGVTYKKISATNKSYYDAAYTHSNATGNPHSLSLDGILDGSGYLIRAGISRAAYCIDAAYNAGFTSLYINGTSTFIGNAYFNNLYASLVYCTTIDCHTVQSHTTYPDSLETAAKSILSFDRPIDFDKINSKKMVDYAKLNNYVTAKSTDKDGNTVNGIDIGATVGCLVECVKYLLLKDGEIK